MMKKPKQGEGSRVKGRGKSKKPFTLHPSPFTNVADLLLEIGTEELPAAYLHDAVEQLRREGERLLHEAGARFAAIEAFGTPRRLVLAVSRLEAVHTLPAEEIRGPSKQAAFTPTGEPTGALTGFLRSRGGTVEQTKLVQTDKGEYVYLVKPARQRQTAAVLPDLLQQLLGRIRLPKTMRWDDSALRFARPIRWLLALHGTRPVAITAGRLRSGRVTIVGGPVRPRRVSCASPATFWGAVAKQGILLDERRRRGRIDELVASAAAQHRGIPAPEAATHGLLDEIANLVERPVAFVGHFDPQYLALPREVLLASMGKYQRVVAIQTRAGALLPQFIGVLDGAPRKPDAVRKMYEHILNARLQDSLLFWEQDRVRSLAVMSHEVSGVTFHEKIGTMAQKQERLAALSGALAQQWALTPQESEALRQACLWSKSDLVSTMVKEFPTLQGIMGKQYAAAGGASTAVAEAIGEHYLPLAGTAPRTLLGQALSILDKYDTLAGYFAIGIEPTGDQDPFGLRRAAQGIVEVAWLVRRPLSLAALFAAWQPLAPFAQGKAAAGARAHRYIFERLSTFDWPKPTPRRDVIAAVLAAPGDDLVNAMERIVALQALGHAPELVRAAKVVERTHNILKSAKTQPAGVNPSLLQEPPERALWDRYEAQKERIAQLIGAGSYAEATTLYGQAFFDPLHDFFDQVMVNVPDAALQQNRLALMQAIKVLYTERVADLSQLELLQPSPLTTTG
ncbi:MAG: glycine--tRNA ligase subunit beta [Candidatus Omnitrophica bacterium]|nr:glycine--tRNA ligase subunit beta [Candidatus Omnitrophota bacterium]